MASTDLFISLTLRIHYPSHSTYPVVLDAEVE